MLTKAETKDDIHEAVVKLRTLQAVVRLPDLILAVGNSQREGAKE